VPAQQKFQHGTLCALLTGQTSTGPSLASVGDITTEASSRNAAQAAWCLLPMAFVALLLSMQKSTSEGVRGKFRDPITCSCPDVTARLVGEVCEVFNGKIQTLSWAQ
jgi:hypothetical protein